MSAKRVLIAHRSAEVRDRFAVAVADARHVFVVADTEACARALASRGAPPIDLAIVDASLADDCAAFVRAIRLGAAAPVPVVVFAGTVRSTADVRSLAAARVGYINEYASTAQILPALAPHLFHDNFNRRASPRLAIGLPVSYRVADAVTAAVTRDLGRGGLAIRTMTPLPAGTAVAVRFRLPGSGSTEIEAACRVVWQDPLAGMGLQFERVSSADVRTIDAFVAAEIARRPA